VGHPENFERILAPHGRDCGVTRDLARPLGAPFSARPIKTLFFLRFAATCESASREELFTSIPNPRASHQ
jgi:hypothetical protein